MEDMTSMLKNFDLLGDKLGRNVITLETNAEGLKVFIGVVKQLKAAGIDLSISEDNLQKLADSTIVLKDELESLEKSLKSQIISEVSTGVEGVKE